MKRSAQRTDYQLKGRIFLYYLFMFNEEWNDEKKRRRFAKESNETRSSNKDRA